MAGIKGTNVNAPVVPFDTSDQHPSHDARYGKGGYRTVATTVERDAIPVPRREAGMLVFVTGDGKVYKLLSDLTSWEEFKSGASTWEELAGKPSTFPPSSHAASHGQGGSDPITVAASQISGGSLPQNAVLDFNDGTSASEIGGWGFGVETGGGSEYATVTATGIVIHGPTSSTTINPAGITFADGSQQTIAWTGSYSHTHDDRYYTESEVDTLLAGKAPLASPTFTGTVSGITATMVGLGNVPNVDATARANHTGTQTASTISDFTTAAAAAAPVQSVNGQTGAVTIATYTLPVATASVLGGVKQGSNVTIGVDGTISVAAPVTSLPYSSLTGVPSTFAPSVHKSSHATGGSDALTASDIGAAASSHTHGNITNAGAIGSTSGQIVVTTTSGVLTTAATISAATQVSGLAASATTDTTSASNISSGSLNKARLPVVMEQTQAIGSSGTSKTFDLSTGSVQTMTLTANCTVTMPTATAGASITLILTQGSSVYTCAFTGVKWPSGTAPTITATANAIDVLVFVSDGTNWYGVVSQKFS